MSKIYKDEGEFSIHVSAIMSGLMVIFLFIAITYIQNLKKENKEAQDIVEKYEEVKEEIIASIKIEFLHEFSEWDALVDPSTLTFQFNSPEVLFKKGSAELTPQFKTVLMDFFARYLKIIKQGKFRQFISAIHIEGHTSSEWGREEGLSAYIGNMQLSQERSSSVLDFILNLNGIGINDNWTRNRITSVGYSSSQIKYKQFGQKYVEDEISSRRVAFRIVTDALSELSKIVNKNS